MLASVISAASVAVTVQIALGTRYAKLNRRIIGAKDEIARTENRVILHITETKDELNLRITGTEDRLGQRITGVRDDIANPARRVPRIEGRMESRTRNRSESHEATAV